MRLSEIHKGMLTSSNIPKIIDPVVVANVEMHDIYSSLWHGLTVLSILDENNLPMSYCILEKLSSGLNRLIEIHTVPAHAGNNLGACILASVPQLGMKLVLLPTDIVSLPGRNLIRRMLLGKKLTATDEDGNLITPQDLEAILDIKDDNNQAIILECIVNLPIRHSMLNPMCIFRGSCDFIYD